MAKDKTKKDLKTPVQPGYPSVQSFYKREVVHSTIKKGEDLAHKAVRQGDGFTEEELADALDPMNKKWNPDRDYEEMTIAELLPGPKAVLFMVCRAEASSCGLSVVDDMHRYGGLLLTEHRAGS